jgi:hypothetical protein
VTDAGVGSLKGLTALEELRLQGTQVTADGIRKLQAALPRTRIWR